MILTIFSFLLDNLMSLFNTGLFYPLFSLLSLVLIYESYKNDRRYYFIAFILGLAYDLAYSDTLILNASIFLLSVFILKYAFKKLSYNYLQVMFVSLLIIIYYRLITYLILVIIKYTSFNLNVLVQSIYSSFIINIIYVTVIYIFQKKLLIFKKMRHIN